MKEVVLSKEAFSKKSLYQKRTKKVKVPELNSLMELKEDEVAVFEIQQLDLSTFLIARAEVNDRVRNLVEGILAASADKMDVAEEVKRVWGKKSPELQYRIEIVKGGVKNPSLKESDILFLCEHFPMVVNRLVDEIMTLTDKGADLKKNSQG